MWEFLFRCVCVEGGVGAGVGGWGGEMFLFGCFTCRAGSAELFAEFYAVLAGSSSAGFLSRRTIVTYLPLLFRLASITGRRL